MYGREYIFKISHTKSSCGNWGLATKVPPACGPLHRGRWVYKRAGAGQVVQEASGPKGSGAECAAASRSLWKTAVLPPQTKALTSAVSGVASPEGPGRLGVYGSLSSLGAILATTSPPPSEASALLKPTGFSGVYAHWPGGPLAGPPGGAPPVRNDPTTVTAGDCCDVPIVCDGFDCFKRCY